jgi:hypothetical protein
MDGHPHPEPGEQENGYARYQGEYHKGREGY